MFNGDKPQAPINFNKKSANKKVSEKIMYLHCHTKGCNWQQDDFWHKKYNPFTKVADSFKWLARPRILELDYEEQGMRRIFSWWLLAREICREVRNVYRMKWWTYKAWKKVQDHAVCPRCKLRNWDMD
jgi:hypothetical protein